MLNRREKIVMQYLFDSCMSNEGKCLLSAQDISTGIYSKIDLTEFEIDEVVQNLVLDGFVDVIYSDKKGRKMYCITLTEQGKGFARQKRNSKINTSVLIARTILLAILSFVVGLILKAIFT